MTRRHARWNLDTVERRVDELNALLRGWSGYFNQGRVDPSLSGDPAIH